MIDFTTNGFSDVMNPAPKVSVISVCYNHERFCTEALDSIVAQSMNDWELIIVDDSSTDSSVQRIEQWIETADLGGKVTFIKHETNRGLCRSLNEAITKASGSYIAMISTDDVWSPEKLAVQSSVLDRSDDTVAVVYSDAMQVDSQGEYLPLTYRAEHWAWQFDEPPSGDVFRALLVNCFLPPVVTLVRRGSMLAVGSFDEDLEYEDWDMWLRLAHQFEFVYSDYPSARYRVLGTSLGRTRRPQIYRSNLQTLEKWFGFTAYEELVQGRYFRFS